MFFLLFRVTTFLLFFVRVLVLIFEILGLLLLRDAVRTGDGLVNLTRDNFLLWDGKGTGSSLEGEFEKLV